MMQGRVADAPLLKQRAGVSARGRKLRNPYAHFTAAWPPGQAPTRDEQLALGDRALSALGLEDHLAVLVAHNETDHAHWHLVVCKVHPDTGKLVSLGRSGLRLSKVAEQWEREHGGIVIDNRVRRREARECYAEYVAGQMSDFQDPGAAMPEAKAEQRAAELDAARWRARDLHPLPPAEQRRGPGALGARRPARHRPHQSACSAAGGGWAMPSIPRWTPSSSPAGPARPLRRWTAATNGTSAHDAGSPPTRAPSSRSCATTTRRSGGRRWHENGNTSANASGGNGSASAPRLPAGDRNRAGPSSRHRQPHTCLAPRD